MSVAGLKIKWFCLLCLLGAIGLYAQNPDGEERLATEQKTAPSGALPYPVPHHFPQTVEEQLQPSMADLKNPDNLKTAVEYDPEDGSYRMVTRLGESILLSTPITLTEDEYADYYRRLSTAAFFRDKNKVDYSKKTDAFSLTDIQFDLGAAEKIFGPGGVQLRTQGSVEVQFGAKNNIVENPALSQRARNRTYFDFDQKIQMSVNGRVGDKINVNMNYDTEAVYDFDAKSIKLRYGGKEDEIIRSLEAGNVSMPVRNSLISGATSLFGVKTELQFGKLNVAAVVSQQNTQTSSASMEGGSQTTKFEIMADSYDENHHYFLSQYFRDHYDEWMSRLPYISSGIVINKVEVWVTNKRAKMDDARHIVAFADLGEPMRIHNGHWQASATETKPCNASNSMYAELVNQYGEARQISSAAAVLSSLNAYGIEIGEDFERLENARRLSSSEYTLNTQLGYISLNTALNADEILAVAFEYTQGGKVYQVGEFSTDGIESPKALFVKLLKGTNVAPTSPVWDLMMKNVYALGAYNMPKKDFRLNITYQNDTVGTYTDYLPEGKLARSILLRVMNLDRLNSQNELYPDGLFDYVEGFTVVSSNGRIIFPVIEPFGSHLRRQIDDPALAERYVFQELYDSTLVVAQELSEKNKFRIEGEYQAANASEIYLGAMNVARGSVKVTAGGRVLTENVDYMVDYISGIVTVTNQDILASGQTINATCEDQGVYNMVRKTFTGVALDYAFSDHFNLGGTVMHLSERPLTNKVDMNTEPLNNTVWGLHTAFDFESQGLTKLIDKLPLIHATAPSKLNVKAEFAQLVPGENKQIDGTVYVDDFESAKKTINLRDVLQWHLASTPFDPTGNFPEASLSNDLRYGYNRALFSWYFVDAIFTQSRSQTPDHIRNDNEQLSNHYVRAVNQKEIYPDKDIMYNQTGLMSIMNLVFYPYQRGPYNFDVDGMKPDGTLDRPSERWGGITRKIESNLTNFEANNVEYIEFWMMDPFVYDSTSTHRGGDLYFNLGDISEDILKDGKKSFENGLPTDGDTTVIAYTKWGKVSNKSVNVYAFDNTEGVRRIQDVGFDGLTDVEEQAYFADYVEKVKRKLTPQATERLRNDPFSPLNDPAGDNFHYYRGSDFDRQHTSILDRYRYYNGPDGNSQARADTKETYETAATTFPDIEDINEDFTLSESERYYQYRVSLRPEDMVAGRNHINDVRKAQVKLKNGKTEEVSWYQFKIPVKEYDKRIGSINGFTNIRFIRMYMTGFEDSVVVRLASLELVRGDWRIYTKDLSQPGTAASEAVIQVSTVDLEENSAREPIHYMLPPGVEREGDPSQPGVYEENEQSLALKVMDLAPGDAKAVYKNTRIDFRQYDRLQMFLHGEALSEDTEAPADYEMTVFIRMGADHQNNYYEYEIPLKISPHFVNNLHSVWPDENFMDLSLELLTRLKNERNLYAKGNYNQVYSIYDPEHEKNKASIKGNPSLSEVKTILIGVRNNGKTVKSLEIWANELRLKGFNNNGGWAAMANASLALSDLGNINLSSHYETDGFGGIEQRLAQRRLDNYSLTNLAMSFDLGKLWPKPDVLNFPVYYSLSRQTNTPKYDPLNEDLLLKDVLAQARGKAERDSIRNYSQALKDYRSFSISNLRLNVRSKTPLPIDPANLSASYSFSETMERDASTEYEITRNFRGALNYAYSSPFAAFEPFGRSQREWLNSPWLKTIKDFSLTYFPNSISFNTGLTRYYYELQNRNLTDPASVMALPLTFSKNFLWDTDFSLNWNVTRNMKLSFTTNNSSRIEETANTPVNRKLFPEEYELWKDTVMQSIRAFGTPMEYQQTLHYTWAVPFNNIPLLDFITTNLQYSSTYRWDRSAVVQDMEVGNTIGDQRSFSVDPQLRLETLYNKSEFLAGANKRFAGAAKKPSAARATANRMARSAEREMLLVPDSVNTMTHKLRTAKVDVTVVDSLGHKAKVKIKVLDDKTIALKVKDTMMVKVRIQEASSNENEPWYVAAQAAARILMSVRDLSMTYQQTDNFTLPGFRPESGLFFQTENYGHAPGWDFATGFYDEHFLDQAIDRNWLVMNDSVVSPAVLAGSRDLRFKSTVEPWPGLKIDLGAQRTRNDNRNIQYMMEGRPETRMGSFSMTTVALRSSLAPINAKSSYYSKAFEHFLGNREAIASRLEAQYGRLNYPSGGFLSGSPLSGQPYDAANAGVDRNSADVLIPAFIAAYTGRSAERVGLDLFPSLRSLLPNWSLSYDGLSKLPLFSKWFSSFSLSHAYTCTYNVTSYNSFNSYVAAEGDFGFVQDVMTGHPIPSSPYNISSVSITESFAPLIGARATLINGASLKAEMRNSRSLNLSITGGQLVESGQQQYVLGGSYQLDDFHPWGILSESKVKNDMKVSADFSFKSATALLRKIEEQYTQATSGNKTLKLELMADYVISRSLNFKMYYDLESSIPLVSSYPVTTQDIGISLRFSLAR